MSIPEEMGAPEEFRPHRLEVTWDATGYSGKLSLSIPWDADANSWAEAFQAIMLCVGFAETTVRSYITSETLSDSPDHGDSRLLYADD